MIDAHFHLLEKNKESSINHSKSFDYVFCMCYPYKEYNIMSLNQAINFSKENPQFKIIAAVNFKKDLKPQIKQIDKLMKQKLIYGIKLYPGCQHKYPFDNQVMLLAKLCLKHNLPLIIHTGVSDDCSYAIEECNNPLHVENLVQNYPNLKIILCHMGYPYITECISMLLKHKNIYADLSGLIEDETSKKEIDAMVGKIKKVGVAVGFEKLIFGSDFPVITDSKLFIQRLKKEFPKTCKNWFFMIMQKGYLIFNLLLAS